MSVRTVCRLYNIVTGHAISFTRMIKNRKQFDSKPSMNEREGERDGGGELIHMKEHTHTRARAKREGERW